MQETSYGFRKHENGDSKTQFWLDAIANVQLVNDHTHDGVNSAKIDPFNINKSTATISSASFSTSGDWQRATVTLPTNYDYDTTNMQFFKGGHQIFPRVDKISDTQFYLYIPYATDIDVLYS